MPVWQQRISPVLDAARRLLVVEQERGRQTGQREVTLAPMPPEALARSVAELGVEVLLCGAVSEALRRALEAQGIRVLPHLCGQVERVLQAFAAGNLWREEFCMPGCRRVFQQAMLGQCRRRRRMCRGGRRRHGTG